MGIKIKSIIIKDFKTLLSDKKALVVILIMPIVLMIILSFALKGAFLSADGILTKVNVAIVKQYDAEADSRRFDNSLKNGFLAKGMGEETTEKLSDSSIEVNPEKIFFKDFLDSIDVSEIISYKIENEDRAKEMLDSGEVSAIVVLPQNYIYDMKINLLTPFRNKVDIKVITHPDRSIDGQIVQLIIEAYSNSILSIVIGKNVLLDTAMQYDLGNDRLVDMGDLMEGIRDAVEGIQVNIEDIPIQGKKQISSADYYAMAMLTMFILFAASHGGRLLLEEKENITYQRMIIAGTPKLGILSGKFLTIFLIALLQIAVMILFSTFALKVQWGDPFSVILISMTAALAVAGIGTAIATATYRTGNYKMASIFETAVIQTMALLGGSFFPIDIMPSFIQKLSFLSLNGIALKAYQKIMMGYGTADVINYIAVLAGIGVLFAIIAVLILRGKGEAVDVKYYKIKDIKA